MLRRNHTLAVGRPTHAGTAPVHRPDEEHFPKVTRPIVRETSLDLFSGSRTSGVDFVMLSAYASV